MLSCKLASRLLAYHITDYVAALARLMEGCRRPFARLCRRRPLPGKTLAAEAGLSSGGNLPRWSACSCFRERCPQLPAMCSIPSPFSGLCGSRGPLPRLAETALWLSRHLMYSTTGYYGPQVSAAGQPPQLLVTAASKTPADRNSLERSLELHRPHLKHYVRKVTVSCTPSADLCRRKGLPGRALALLRRHSREQ